MKNKFFAYELKPEEIQSKQFLLPKELRKISPRSFFIGYLI
ncbi:MAG: hypothetical protein Q8S14_19310 [Algoriphagus sp.]|nr:hypothetical protein [Algoriphagus sp.]MDP2042287.1 hypothetical protein [Algoriphagus sp.]MDP3474026.1 hypothetical protein [Algoriphagus sp.]